MAARPLSSAGIVVLQTQWNAVHFSERQEAFDQVAMFEAAIQQLDKDGLIDKNRVGIIGFSRTVGHVEQSLIDKPSMFAAATIADGLDLGYLQYRLFAEGRPPMTKEFVRMVGTTPEGNGLKTWLDSAPSFHMDKEQAPLRIEAIDPSSILAMWETYATLRELNKPVDLIYVPGGQHILQKPLDRMASQQGNVDWFRFWLQGYERPNPEDVEQYKRWEHLRELRDADAKTTGQAQDDNASKPN
jgi:poly(3-hydroxybutyrate) depolymerase